MFKNSPKYIMISLVIFSLTSFSFAQSYNRIYAPNTRALNFVDAISLHAYCKLSKIFEKEENRDKCFISESLAISNLVNSDLKKTNDISTLENRVSNYEKEVSSLRDFIYSTSSQRDTTKVINNTIIKYVSAIGGSAYNNQNQNTSVIKNNSMATGMFNTILSPHSYVYGANNTVYANASNTLTLGENINNNIANSVQIGLNDNTKLTILGTSTENKNNGWVGIGGRTSALNFNSCGNATNTNCFESEMLRVPGKIVARAFEVNGAADLAENFPADDNDLEAGHIVEFGEYTHTWNTGGNAEVSGDYEISGVVKAKSSKKAIGIVATNPGVILGGGMINSVPIAFSGRVPVKVTEENGKVLKGDKVKVSDIQNGFGAKSILDGNVVGTAISDSKNGVVLVLVKSEYIYTNNNLK